MKIWFINNMVGIIGVLQGGFVSYHVYFLSKKLSNKAKLEHKEKIKKKVESLLYEIRNKKIRSKVYLVNLNRYFKDYPSNEEKLFGSYSHIGAEIKATRFDGIEFFTGIVEVYKNKNGKLTLNNKNGGKSIKVFEVGIVPYEWIDCIDLNGDEYGYNPLVYCHFKGRIYWKFWKRFLLWFGYPYKKIIYYGESNVYREGEDPLDMKYVLIREEISKK